MKVTILSGGSKGNCIAVQSGEACILIDAGVPKSKIEKLLLQNGINPKDIQAIFITHAHKDHIQGLPLANKYGIPVYAAEEEWKSIKNVDSELRCPLLKDECVILDQRRFWVEYFKTHHDAYDSLGYTIECGGKKASICLDTGKVDPEMLEAMKGSDIYIIEANHEPNRVEECRYPTSVKARILSDLGHLSNQQCAEALCELVRGVGEHIYLTHLSSHNNSPEYAENTIKLALYEKGLIKGQHYQLEVIT